MITGILIALPDEVSSLTHKKIRKGECISLNKNTLVALSGAGAKNATKASQLLIKNGANKLISWGCAAALAPRLQAGDLILAGYLLSADQQRLSIQSDWLKHSLHTLKKLRPSSGLLIESKQIVATSHDKQKIHQQTGGVALDMESVAMVKVAQIHSCPALVIRSIADPVEMSLPNAVNYALNEEGDIILRKLLWFLLTHPSELPNLIRLGSHFSKAKHKLKLVSKQLDIITGFEPENITE